MPAQDNSVAGNPPHNVSDTTEGNRYTEFGMRLLNSVTAIPMLLPLNAEVSAFGVKIRLSESTRDGEIVALDEAIPLELLIPALYGIVHLISQGTESKAFQAGLFDTLHIDKSELLDYLDKMTASIADLRKFMLENFSEDD